MEFKNNKKLKISKEKNLHQNALICQLS